MKFEMPAEADITLENLPKIVRDMGLQLHACVEVQGEKIDALAEDMGSKFDAIQASADERHEATRKVRHDLAGLRQGEIALLTKQNAGLAKSQKNLAAQHRRLGEAVRKGTTKIDEVAGQVTSLTSTVDQNVSRIQEMKEAAEAQTKKITAVDGKVDFAAGQLDILRVGMGLPAPSAKGEADPKVKRLAGGMERWQLMAAIIGAAGGAQLVIRILWDAAPGIFHAVLTAH